MVTEVYILYYAATCWYNENILKSPGLTKFFQKFMNIFTTF